MDTPPKSAPSPRSPIFIELAGTPAAGKTTIASRLHRYFTGSGVRSAIAEEPAARYPGSPEDKLAPTFNQWTLGESLAAVSEYRMSRSAEVVIFDRGAFDSLFWLTWFKSSHGLDQAAFAASAIVARPLVRHISCLVIMTCSFEVARQRRPQAGRIMNPGIYPQLLANYGKPATSDEIGVSGVSHLRLDTSELQIGTVEARIRAFLGAPQDGDRNEVLGALVKHSAYARQNRGDRSDA